MSISMEYEFDELSIPLSGGVHAGFFTGGAVIEEDDCNEFAITGIWLDGEKRKLIRTASGLTRVDLTAVKTWLPKPPYDSSGTFEQRLYRLIETEMYADSALRDAWAEHLWLERADA